MLDACNLAEVYGPVALVHVVLDGGEGQRGIGRVEGRDADLQQRIDGGQLLRLVAFEDGLLSLKVRRSVRPYLGRQLIVRRHGREVCSRLLEGVDAQTAVPEREQLVHATARQRIVEGGQRDASFGQCEEAFALQRVRSTVFGDILREVGNLPHERRQ